MTGKLIILTQPCGTFPLETFNLKLFFPTKVMCHHASAVHQSKHTETILQVVTASEFESSKYH